MPTIHFLNDELGAEATEGESLSLVAHRAGASLSFGCRAGTCGTCAITVEEGEEGIEAAGFVEEDTLTVVGASGPGRRLACQVLVGRTDLGVSW